MAVPEQAQTNAAAAAASRVGARLAHAEGLCFRPRPNRTLNRFKKLNIAGPLNWLVGNVVLDDRRGGDGHPVLRFNRKWF